jgi:hypothetical protein
MLNLNSYYFVGVIYKKIVLAFLVIVIASLGLDSKSYSQSSLLEYDFEAGLDPKYQSPEIAASAWVTSVANKIDYLGGGGNPGKGAVARYWIGGRNNARCFSFDVTNTSSARLALRELKLDLANSAPGIGPQQWAIMSSADGFVSDLATGSLGFAPAAWRTVNVPLNISVDSNRKIEFRIIAWGANSIPPQGGHLHVDNVTLSGGASLAITAQPSMGTFAVGEDMLLQIAAVGSGTINYQWRKDGANIQGATESTFLKKAAQLSDSGDYDVQVSNWQGSIVSSTLTVNIVSPPSILAHPTSLLSNIGTSATFAVQVDGGGGFSYQWRRNGVPISGAASANYTITALQFGHAGDYDVVVSNAAGAVTSNVAKLIVLSPIQALGVTFSQRTDGSRLVDVRYSLTGGSSSVALGVSLDGGTTFTSVKTLTGDVGAAVAAGTAKHIVWNAGADYANLGAPGVKVRVTPLLDGAGGSFTPIPGGTYQMGNLTGGCRHHQRRDGVRHAQSVLDGGRANDQGAVGRHPDMGRKQRVHGSGVRGGEGGGSPGAEGELV